MKLAYCTCSDVERERETSGNLGREFDVVRSILRLKERQAGVVPRGVFGQDQRAIDADYLR